MEIKAFISWLLLSTAMASVLACIIFIAKAIFKNKLGARGHYCIWLLLIIRLVLPYFPESQFSAFNLINFSGHSGAISINISYEQNNTLPGAEDKIPAQTPNSNVTQPSGIPVQALDYGIQSESKNQYIAWDIIFIIWLMGLIAFGAYAAVLNVRFWLKIKGKAPVSSDEISKTLDECKLIMGIKRELPIVDSFEISTPALYGFRKPKLIIPHSITQSFDHEGLKYIFFHELSHLKRRDIALNWLIGFLKIFHWFNPLLWYAFYRMRQDCEIACDSLALSYMDSEDRKKYGNTIISLLETRARPVHLAGMAGILEDKSQIKRRITMISLFKKNSYKWTVAAVVILIIIGAVFLTNAKSAASEADTNNIPVSGSDIKPGTISDNSTNNNGTGNISESKLVTVTTDMYELTLPDYLSAIKLPGSRLTFRKSEKVVGGLEIIGYYPDQPMSSLFPNHSETLYTKDLEGLELKAVEAKIRMTPPAASGSTEATDSIHIYLLDGVKNIAYDISVDPSYVDEDTLLSIAKSFKLKSPYSANEPAGASSSVEASDLVLSTNHLDINEGTVQSILTLRMVKGKINNSTDPGPFMGKTMEGSFSLELSDNSGKQVSSFDLNSAFNGENLVFKDNFDISFEDYNGDGCMDFTIGQYASSNGYTYVIFSIDKQGRITRLPIKDKNELFSDNMGYSPKLVRVGDSSFILQYYDNSRGKRFESTYKWDNGQFVMVGEKEI